ncbi:hypothetical protein ACFLRF_05325 [Candidatus Altiarchaeota archaeon]
MASPVIRRLKEHVMTDKDVLIDAPPGTSCAVIESVKASDYCILVTEPTPFGLNDLELAVEMLESMDLPHGVIINRDGIGNDDVLGYCESKGIPIHLRIPHDPEIARLYSEGIPFIKEMPEYRMYFRDVHERILEELG